MVALRLLSNIAAGKVVAEAVVDGPDVARVVLLANVLGIVGAIGSTVVGASEDTVLAVLVDDIGVEEDAGLALVGAVDPVVLGLGNAAGGAEARVKRDVGAEGLRAEVAVVDDGSGGVDGGLAEADGTLEAIDGGTGGLGEGSRAGIDDLEVGTLDLVGGGLGRGGGERHAVEGALDQSGRGGVGSARAAEGGIRHLLGLADLERHTLVVDVESGATSSGVADGSALLGVVPSQLGADVGDVGLVLGEDIEANKVRHSRVAGRDVSRLDRVLGSSRKGREAGEGLGSIRLVHSRAVGGAGNARSGRGFGADDVGAALQVDGDDLGRSVSGSLSLGGRSVNDGSLDVGGHGFDVVGLDDLGNGVANGGGVGGVGTGGDGLVIAVDGQVLALLVKRRG